MSDVIMKDWNGSPVDEETRQEWVDKCIRHLQNHPKEMDTSIMSGDSMVVVERHMLGSEYESFWVFDLFIRRNAIVHLDKVTAQLPKEKS
jgi:gluconate kinase